MGNLVAQHDSQRSLILSDGQQALINHNQSARHTPGVSLIIGYKIKCPLIILYIILISVSVEEVYNGIGQIGTNALYHSCVSGIGRDLGGLHKLLILLG